MSSYKTILYGATMAAIGIAICDPEHTLILEPGNLPAPEFYSAMRYDIVDERKITQPHTTAFYELLKKEHKVVNGLIETLELMPDLASFIKERKLQILFDCRVMTVKQEHEDWTLHTICRNVQNRLNCQTFLDTRDEALINTTLPLTLSYNAVVKMQGDLRLEDYREPFSWNGVYVIELPVPSGFTYPQLRTRMLQAFDKQRLQSEDRLLKAADAVCIRGIPGFFPSHPTNLLYSAFAANMIDALQQGELYGRTYL